MPVNQRPKLTLYHPPQTNCLIWVLEAQEALQELIDALVANPGKGALIKDTGGIRKIRWVTGKGHGKRGGLRVFYYFNREQLILLVTLFKKADKENIDAGEKEILRKLINELQGD